MVYSAYTKFAVLYGKAPHALVCSSSTVFTDDAQHGDLCRVVEWAWVYGWLVVNCLGESSKIFWYWNELLELYKASGLQRLQCLHHCAPREEKGIIGRNQLAFVSNQWAHFINQP